MSADHFPTLFRSSDGARDKFLARLFGIFSEEIVRIWCRAPEAPYEDLGRPTIRCADEKTGYTLDFTLRDKQDEKIYVSEMKCELQYENYRYLSLEAAQQLDHHARGKAASNEAFRRFLQVARTPASCVVTVKNKAQLVDGAILIWGHCTPQGREAVLAHYGLHSVLSVDAMVQDLIAWKNLDYLRLLDQRQTWCQELFTGLSSGNVP